MDVLLRHALTYTTDSDVPVEIVARSLIANERLIREALQVIESLSPGTQISGVRIKVSSLSNASPLKQAFAVALFMTFQKDLERQVPLLIQRITGHAVPEHYNTLITVLVIMVAMAAITTATERLFPGKDVKKLKKEYEDKLTWFSQSNSIDKDELDETIKKAVEKKEVPLLKKAMEFFLPAKLERGAEIILEHAVGLGVTAGAIEEIPQEISVAPDGSRAAYDLEGVVIDIHRSDMDQGKHGWRAIIESVSSKKVRLELAPDLDASKLYGKRVVVGNVTVIEERDERGELGPQTYYLSQLIRE